MSYMFIPLSTESEQSNTHSVTCGDGDTVKEQASQRLSLVRWLVPALVAGLLLLLPSTGHVFAMHNVSNSPILAFYASGPEQEAHCFFDSSLATNYLASAGETINQASRNCKNGKDEDGNCSISMTKMVEEFAHAASYFASGISHCPGQFQTNHMCESQAAKSISGFAQIAVSAQRIHYDCVKSHHKFYGSRRLSGTQGLNVGEETASAGPNETTGSKEETMNAGPSEDIVKCTMQGSKAVLELGESVMYITRAVSHCPMAQDFQKGEEQTRCAASVQGALLSLGHSANNFATLAIECGKNIKGSSHKKCELAVSKLIMALSDMAASASGMHLHCLWTPNDARLASQREEPGSDRRLN